MKTEKPTEMALLQRTRWESFLFRGLDAIPGVISFRVVLTPFCKGIYSKRKEFVPRRSIFFPLRIALLVNVTLWFELSPL